MVVCVFVYVCACLTVDVLHGAAVDEDDALDGRLVDGLNGRFDVAVPAHLVCGLGFRISGLGLKV